MLVRRRNFVALAGFSGQTMFGIERAETLGSHFGKPLVHLSQHAPSPQSRCLDVTCLQRLHDMGLPEEWPQCRRDGDADVPALSALVDVLVVGHRGLLPKRVPLWHTSVFWRPQENPCYSMAYGIWRKRWDSPLRQFWANNRAGLRPVDCSGSILDPVSVNATSTPSERCRSPVLTTASAFVVLRGETAVCGSSARP